MLYDAIVSELPHLARYSAAPHHGFPRVAVAAAARTATHDPRMLALLLPVAASTYNTIT